MIHQLPKATLLVNLSNDGELSSLDGTPRSPKRELKTGRYMLRATNTGATSIIRNRSHVASLPQQTSLR